mgnify:CR=1 FL=1
MTEAIDFTVQHDAHKTIEQRTYDVLVEIRDLLKAQYEPMVIVDAKLSDPAELIKNITPPETPFSKKARKPGPPHDK